MLPRMRTLALALGIAGMKKYRQLLLEARPDVKARIFSELIQLLNPRINSRLYRMVAKTKFA